MSLSPRAIAVQGIGFSPRLVSVHGLWPDTGSYGGGVRRMRLPRSLVDAQRIALIDEDDVLLTIAAALSVGAGSLQ